MFFPSSASSFETDNATIHLSANRGGSLQIGGGSGPIGGGEIFLKSRLDKPLIHLDGNAGDIILENANCAEDFVVVEAEPIPPGSVVVLDDEANVRLSRQRGHGQVSYWAGSWA